MGFPTPFPEPESPELQRFAMRSPSEIVNRLRTIQHAAVPLNAFVGGDASVCVVMLRRVDPVAGQLVFAGTELGGLRERQAGAPLTTIVGYDDSCKVQFTVRPAMSSHDQVFASPIPEQLFLLQRRSAARMRLDGAKAAVCRIPIPGVPGEWEALRVADIGVGGIAMLAFPERFEPIVGQEIENCRLDLPGIGGVVVNVLVRHLGLSVGNQQARVCGCAFARLSPTHSSMIGRYIENSGNARTQGG